MVDWPQRIGPYRIVRVLGEGGMGTVYLAEQDEPVQRQVALKVIRRGRDGKEVLARFAFERRALAAMNHSAIAKVFDAGATDAGQPFFAMEYVPGIPITDYCDRHRLDLEQRIRLFRQVCDGVQHAHQKGVLHRDLKPVNVLVSDEGGRHVAKVIDFGLARAVEHGLDARSLLTEQGQLIGTPEYMSPEQAAGFDDAIDTRTDIYSLGVMLYVLLAGELPLGSDALRRTGLLEVLRLIREQEPPKPSARVSGMGARVTASAGVRRTTPSGLRRALRGDLDWIVMRAMAKEPERRYASAFGLAEDLACYLAHEPVSAGPPGAGYRLRKLARRYRVQLAAVALVGLSLLAGIVVSTHFAVEAHAQAIAAEQAAAGTTAIHDFLVERLIRAATPDYARGHELTAREILDQAVAEVDGAFPEQPELAAAVRSTLGDALWKTGRNDEAVKCLRAAYQELRRARGRGDRDTLMAAHRLAWVLCETGELDEAEVLFRDNLRLRLAALGPQHKDTLASRYALAQVLSNRDQHREAAVEFESVWQARRTVLGPYHQYTLNALRSWASELAQAGRLREALPLMRRLVEEAGHLPSGDPMIGTASNDLALCLTTRGDWQEAGGIYARVLAETAKVEGADSISYAITLNNYADVLQRMGRHEEALAKMEESVRIRQKVYSPEHRSVGRARMNLGLLLGEMGQHERALVELRAALEIMMAAGGEHDREAVKARTALARGLAYGRDAAAAEVEYRKALADGQAAWPAGHWEYATVQEGYADFLISEHRGRKAVPLLEVAFDAFDRQLGREHWRTQQLVERAIALGEQLGDAEAAARWRQRRATSLK